MRIFVFLTLLLTVFSLNVMAQFSSEDELSLVQTGGNTSVETFSAKSANMYSLSDNKLIQKLDYVYGENSKIRTVERWNFLLRADHDLTDKFSIFVSELVEANRFSGIQRRYNTDIGLKFVIVKADRTNWYFEGSYRYTIEKRSNNLADLKDSKARFYSEVIHKLKTNITTSLWVEYLPNFSRSEDYLINFGPSLQVMMTEVFSLKTSYAWNYDNLPVPDKGKHDTTFTTSLIAKF